MDEESRKSADGNISDFQDWVNSKILTMMQLLYFFILVCSFVYIYLCFEDKTVVLLRGLVIG